MSLQSKLVRAGLTFFFGVAASGRCALAEVALQKAIFEPTEALVHAAGVDHGELQLAQVEGQHWIQLKGNGPDVRWTVKAPGGTWDLSSAASLTVTVRNPSSSSVIVRWLAANPEADGLSGTCRGAAVLQADETRDLTLPLTRRPEDPTYKPFEPFYMYYKALNVRDDTVDAAKIARVTFAVSGKELAMGVYLSAVRPTGQGKPGMVPFFPFIDAYGQYVHSDWPGKIYSDADFAAHIEEEKHEEAGFPQPDEWDKYGGWKNGPNVKATGFFYPTKQDGKWWLVDPDGKLFWSYGPTGVGFGGDVTPVSDRSNWFVSNPSPDDPKFGQFFSRGHGATYMYYHDRAWEGFDIQQANLLRKYGPDYKKLAAEISHQRLHSWGFNTIGNWSDPQVYMMHETPYVVPVHYESALIHFHMPDVYDPSWEPAVRASMEKQRNTTAGDPWCIGYFIDNERWFGWRPRGAAIAEETMKNPPTRKAKVKFEELLKNKYHTIGALNAAWGTQHASWDAFLAYRPSDKEADELMKNKAVLADGGDFGMMFAERYFTVCHDIEKSVAPNNMYLGSRFFGHTDPELVAMASKHMDVISYNIYDNPPDGRVNQYSKIDRPIMSTEWGIDSDPTQTPFRDEKLTAPLPADRAYKITQYVEHALNKPNMVGAHFFQFRDQPLSGRPDGEAVLRGFVNVADTPNFELVAANRAVAYHMYQMRAAAK